MGIKSEQLQIRVTPRQKAALKRAAAAAGQDVSTYVLTRALPPARLRFEELLDRLRHDTDHRFALAELNDLLTALGAGELRDGVSAASLEHLSPFLRNYVAAMVEQACYLRDVPAPSWVAQVAPLATPYFATSLASLRTYLLRVSPVPFRRRNIFIDATLGARV